ncbi:hypothetical protein PDM28_01070 [Stenotrophomonas aracearum]|jgi:hypothetical protein|uniref:Lipoprotein n=1 Tax=Stenotrophomonas aracearum TaxID=3003272 RepID=A0ABY9YDK8_9GAMM|nr:hypothetical protein [Stenotrophomonas sp. A5588]WNH48956.1 hypothetical protein PDM28_01070 [Stenotrophomonas sp. A5588]
MTVQKLLIAAVLGGAAAGCQSAATKPIDDVGEAQVEVEGVVEIYSGGHGLGYITLDDGKCYDLALPANVLKNSQRWDTKRVLIKGSLQFRPRLDEMMWFDIKDRKIEGFGCSEDVIYVESIKKL